MGIVQLSDLRLCNVAVTGLAIESCMRILRSLILATVTTLLLTMGSQAQKEPSSKPRLRVETGQHIGSISGFGVGGGGKLLATGGSDRTARLWDISTGALLRTFRPPIGQADEGEIYSADVSEDGALVACGGVTGREWGGVRNASVYLFDTRTGALKQTFGALGKDIKCVKFSPDGKFLAITVNAGFSDLPLSMLSVIRLSDGKTVLQPNISFKVSFAVDWDRSGRLAVASDSGHVILYSPKFEMLTEKSLDDDKIYVQAIAFSPDGTKIAVSNKDGKKIEVLSATDLAKLYEPNTGDIADDDKTGVGKLMSVAWSPDGKFLYAGGSFVKIDPTDLNKGDSYIRRFADSGKGAFVDIAMGSRSFAAFETLPSGQIAYLSGTTGWGVLTAELKVVQELKAPLVTASVLPTSLRLSRDGKQVRFDYDAYGNEPALFSLSSQELLVQTPDSTVYFGLSDFTKPSERDIAPFETGLKTNAFEMRGGEETSCVASSPDKKLLLVGTNYRIVCFDTAGKMLWSLTAPDRVENIAISGDNLTAAALYKDGTIRLYRTQNGYNTVAFFPHADKKRWVLWTRSGYYAASTGGEDLLGWHLNKGLNSAAEFYPISRFREAFYRPDVIEKALASTTEELAVVAANTNKKVKPLVAVEDQLPPSIAILSPDDGASLSSDSVTVRFQVSTPSGSPVTSVRALVDGRAPGKDLVRVLEAAGEERSLTVSIPRRDCTITLLAENKNAISSPASIRVSWKGAVAASDDAFVAKPKLYVLSIGVGKFASADLNPLDYPAKDARDFAAAMQTQNGGLYREVVVKTITDEQATRDEIVDGLDWLQKQTTSKDVAMLFLSGHGTNDSTGAYNFVPTNFDFEKLKRTGINFNDIKNTLEQIAGKAIFFVDSCHSGNVLGQKTRGAGIDINRVVNELSSAENGVVVFTASTGKQVALEDPKWGNGAFTKAVVEGILGKADFNKTGRITINMLDLYISERVKELTGGKQTPTTTKPSTIPDFPLAIKK